MQMRRLRNTPYRLKSLRQQIQVELSAKYINFFRHIFQVAYQL